MGEEYSATDYNSDYKTGLIAPEDQVEIKVHLGCTDEVSSFEAIIANFDKKYTQLFAFVDLVHILAGRDPNLPMIFNGKVEEIRFLSSAMENYIRLRGRCWGEWLFQKLVTNLYENQKGETIVKHLIDNYVGLSHVRGSTELIEATDTTYTKLEYENTPVFDILKYIAKTADKAGAIGFDFRVATDGKFEFFPKNTKTSIVPLSEKLDLGEYRKDIFRKRDRIYVYGAAEKREPSDGDAWTETLAYWYEIQGTLGLLGIKKIGNYSVACSRGDGNTVRFYRTHAVMPLDSRTLLKFYTQDMYGAISSSKVRLRAPDENNYFEADTGAQTSSWTLKELPLGNKNIFDADLNPTGVWTKVGSPSWQNIHAVEFVHTTGYSTTGLYVDGLHYFPIRWSSTYGSGSRELAETDEELHSDDECLLRAKALYDHLSSPAEYIRVTSDIIDYGTTPILAGDRIWVTLPNENVDGYYRVISAEYRLIAETQTLEVTLELGKERPLLADYLYALRSKTASVSRYKIGGN